jgi:hypothetical protein
MKQSIRKTVALLLGFALAHRNHCLNTRHQEAKRNFFLRVSSGVDHGY